MTGQQEQEVVGTTDIDPRQREILRLLWREGRMSRWELHQRIGVNPNAIGLDVAALLTRGIIRECPSEPLGPGRPRIPLEIDPLVRHVVGIAISPGRAEAARLTLRGNLLGRPISRTVKDPADVVNAAQKLLKESLNDRTVAVGLSVTGLVDPLNHGILTSSSLPGRGAVSLDPLYEIVQDRPLILENNMHALAAWWLLTHQAGPSEDVLLVNLGDGMMGAALLTDGRPNRGCVIGANELGHVRFFLDTDTCYCGHQGCLERICSTEFLRRRGVSSGTLLEHAVRYEGDNPAMKEILDHLSAGLANAVNFIRPHRLVPVGAMTRYPAFTDPLIRSIRSRLLSELAKRVRIELWDPLDSHGPESAEAAGWLALASLYREGWVVPA